MNIPQKRPRRVSPIPILAFGCLFAAPGLFAQAAATGAIQPRLDGSTPILLTANDDAFRFDDVPAGPATITVSFTG